MADVRISALTAIATPADADELPIVDVSVDVDKKITLAQIATHVEAGIAETEYPLLLTRAGAGTKRSMFLGGPTTTTQSCSTTTTRLALCRVMGGYTPESVSIGNITAAGTESGVYVVIYNLKPEDGLPGTLAASWGPFSTAATGTVTLTGQTTPMPASGLYWVGFRGSGSGSGAPTADGWLPALTLFTSADERNSAIVVTSSGAPGDLSAETGWAADRFVCVPNILCE
jgi:hypothetical protein